MRVHATLRIAGNISFLNPLASSLTVVATYD